MNKHIFIYELRTSNPGKNKQWAQWSKPQWLPFSSLSLTISLLVILSDILIWGPLSQLNCTLTTQIFPCKPQICSPLISSMKILTLSCCNVYLKLISLHRSTAMLGHHYLGEKVNWFVAVCEPALCGGTNYIQDRFHLLPWGQLSLSQQHLYLVWI